MKKALIAFAIIVGLFGAKVFAGDQPWKIASGTLSGTVASFSTTPIELAYIVVSSTGSDSNAFHFCTKSSTITTVGAPTSAGNQSLDLTRTPVRVSNASYIIANNVNTTCRYTIVYRDAR